MPKRAHGAVVGDHSQAVTVIRTPEGRRTESVPGKGGADGSGAWSIDLPALGRDRVVTRLVGSP